MFPPQGFTGVQYGPLSGPWLVDALIAALIDTHTTGKMHQVLIRIDGYLAAIVILFRKPGSTDTDTVYFSRSEFCNLDGVTPKPRDLHAQHQLLALPYGLYRLVAGLQERVAFPVAVEPLWGWGVGCSHVHDAVMSALHRPCGAIERLEPPEDLDEWRLENEWRPFMTGILQWLNHDHERLTYAVVMNQTPATTCSA